MNNILVSLYHKDNEGYNFDVYVKDPDSTTTHKVDMSESQYQELTKGRISPEVLIERSFQFLLSKEPKESILPVFNIVDIMRFFPEYKDRIKFM